jgi:hypothetical protein
VDTAAAEEAFRMLHATSLNARIDVQAHRTSVLAEQTMAATFPIGFQLEGGKADEVPDPSAEHHERNHPADIVAACAAAEKHGKSCEDSDEKIIEHIRFWTAGRIIE